MERRSINFIDRDEAPLRPAPAPEPERDEPPLKRRSYLSSCLIATLIVLALFFMYKMIPIGGMRSNDPNAYDPITLEPKPPEGIVKRLTSFVFHKEQTLTGERQDRINVLLLGMGGPGHDGPYLTDTIMIVSIKPSTHEVALISIPRDLGVKIPGYGVSKVNAANSQGEKKQAGWGGAFASQVIGDTLNLPIHYYVRADFQAFKEIIDTAGGVTVKVDRTFSDPLFPTANNGYQTVSFTAGTEEMGGERALEFARSRHGSNGEGSDFARAARQQKVILSLKDKLLSFDTLANPIRIHNIITSLDSHVTTNMEFSEIIDFVRLARSLDTSHITRLVLDDGPNGYLVNATGVDGAFLLFPKTGNFDAINDRIATIFSNTTTEPTVTTPTEVTPAPTKTETHVEIQNGTWQAGMAARIQKRLGDNAIVAETVGNTEDRPVAKSGIYIVGAGTNERTTASQISSLLHIPIKEGTTPPHAPKTTILVILGDDFEE